MIFGNPLTEEKFILDTNANNVGLGDVLLQIQHVQVKVISYFRLALTKEN